MLYSVRNVTLSRFALSAMILGMSGVTQAQVAEKFTEGVPIKIGVIFPMTGPSSDMGISAVNGVKVAVQEINSAGGYLGRRIELVVRDDEGKPDVGAKAADELVNKIKVTATIGFCNTGVAMKSLETFQSKQNVLLVTCATGGPVTAKYPAADSFIFRIAPRSKLQADFIINDIVNQRGIKNVAIIADSTPYGDSGVADLVAALQSKGLQPTLVKRFEVGAKSLNSEFQELKASGAQAVVGWTVSAAQATISRARSDAKWDIPQYGDWTLFNDSAYTGSFNAADRTLSPQTILKNDYLERNRSFSINYKKLSGEKNIGSMMSAAQSYDGMHLLIRSFFDSKGDLSGVGIKKALENQDRPYYGVVTTYENVFSSKDHDAISSNMLWLGTWRGYNREFHYAEDVRKSLAIRRKDKTPTPMQTGVVAETTLGPKS